MSDSQHPINAFPEYVQKIIYHHSECKGYPIEWFILCFLGATSTAVGRAVTLNTGNYTSIANIWGIVLGKKGFTKSEALKDAFKPIKSYQNEIMKRYRTDLEELEYYRSENPKAKTNDLPKPKKITLSDVTSEKLVMILSENPKGCTIIYDEIAGFIKRFDRYTSGGDEQMFLSLFNGDSIERDRMSGVDAYAPHSYLSIIGTTQPTILKSVFTGKSESGFFDRWIISMPDDVKKQYPSQLGLNPIEVAKYYQLFTHLLSLEFNEINHENQMSYSRESYEIINKYQCKLVDVENTTESDELRGILAKMEIYLHKFALLLQCIEYSITGDELDLGIVSVNSAKGAVILTEYFIEEAKKVRITTPNELLKGKWIDVFDALPEHGILFNRKHFLKLCAVHGFKESAADKFLKEHGQRDESTLLFKVKHGEYTKNLF
jgi:hypothetical protein